MRSLRAFLRFTVLIWWSALFLLPGALARISRRRIEYGARLTRLWARGCLKLLGGKVEVPTVDGKARVTIKPGTQPGSILRLRGKGLPSPERYGTGDLLINVMVYMPEKLSDREREAITMLQSGEHVKPSDSDKSRIFSRLRHIFD